MKKAILSGLRWGMDAGFLFTLSQFLVTLFYTGLASIGFGLRVVTEDFFFWCVFPLAIGAATGAVFSFILIKFRPNKRIYISICAIIGMMPMYPSIFNMIIYIGRENLRSGFSSIIVYYILYLLTCILLSNYIYKKNAVMSNDNPSAS